MESDGRPETGSDSGTRTDSCSGKAESRRSEELRWRAADEDDSRAGGSCEEMAAVQRTAEMREQ